MNNHQKSTFHPLGNFLNPALALLGQGLRKSPIWQKLNFANHPYLCKGLNYIDYFRWWLITFLKIDNKWKQVEPHRYTIKIDINAMFGG
ncbi:hypothetical protein BHECKSOX2_753 [Bathymodiolus heckerae thiotrophic gill symbiont]|uniref:hypothetical protein n=1 Tax=Bathymodiolus heckerae thiotrophic gill symbiont TaxID=1052212 RepID=UPI0010B5B3A9|nr:hypothetical protein [Bathymodiolus heckerae thiotrophic gill symbiont]SMN13630.1 hypothetical protein BHECKSOX2_753 [Bathymodiolus heckerae thiotrophic gill symbiont]